MAAIPGHGTATITAWNVVSGKIIPAPALDMVVDFDPQSLELTYSMAGPPSRQTTDATGVQRNQAPGQLTSRGTTLTFTLVFDSTDTNQSVQQKTEPLVSLTQPSPGTTGSKNTNPQPVVRFHWGMFIFYGRVQSLNQTIDYFSSGGTPLRATLHVTLEQVDPPSDPSKGPSNPNASFGLGIGTGAASVSAAGSVSGSASASVGTSPLTLSTAGDTVQSITGQAAVGVSWKSVAAANNVDNPRLLPAGTVLDLSLGTGT
jgi:hypothetical protein